MYLAGNIACSNQMLRPAKLHSPSPLSLSGCGGGFQVVRISGRWHGERCGDHRECHNNHLHHISHQTITDRENLLSSKNFQLFNSLLLMMLEAHTTVRRVCHPFRYHIWHELRWRVRNFIKFYQMYQVFQSMNWVISTFLLFPAVFWLIKQAPTNNCLSQSEQSRAKSRFLSTWMRICFGFDPVLLVSGARSVVNYFIFYIWWELFLFPSSPPFPLSIFAQ